LEELLSEAEFENIAIADLAKRAGVAVGSVYSHFKDKSALLPTLLERRLDRVEARIAELEIEPPAGADLRETVKWLVDEVRRQSFDERGPLRALLTHRRLYPDLDVPRRSALNDRFVDIFQRALERHREEIGWSDLKAAAQEVYYVLHTAFLDDILFNAPPLPSSVTPSLPQKADALTDMIHRRLTGHGWSGGAAS
jgi:AcrR family transcriptional regulator